MSNPSIQPTKITTLSLLPSQQPQQEENIIVTHFQHPAGEGTCLFQTDHTLSMSLAPSPVRLLHSQDGKTCTGLYKKGDFMITPVNLPLFARWDSYDNYLQVRIKDQFIKNVIEENLDKDPDRLELLPKFLTRNPQIEAIGMMLVTEIEQKNVGSRLYVDSIANLLAINLLREYAGTKTNLPVYEGGLPQYQIRKIMEYIDTHLDSEIRLTNLAELLDMSQFHFSRLFKQSMGISPHQYLIQQRVERAKKFLQQTDLSIVEISLECGFSSHSHLTKQFRQLTGMTPKVYRVNG
ncbi:MAG: helix-turn-helix transcriptional regulator [Sphaerospermopsis sp. SIO1G2]|nr:helix-turn-helix transcriptional regulator [Sphaerospermopsis sp. SIO1G1]NET70781.1 helix-turn-helix transcriptional regulator [Sphaerospermopsis sp. SIO1G2]